MSQAKTKNKATINSPISFQKKPLEVAVGAAVMVLCAGAQASTYTSGVGVERLDHELINFTRTYTDIFGRVDTVTGGSGGGGGSASSASSGAAGVNGQAGAVGTNAVSSSGARTFQRLHVPETTTNSAVVSVNTITNSLSPITGILLDARVVPDSSVTNSITTISAETAAYGGVGGAGGPGGAGATLDNAHGGVGGAGGVGGSATGAAVTVDASMRRVFNTNATVSDNSVTNSSLGVITTSGSNRAGIGLQALSEVGMTVTTNSAAHTFAYGGVGGNGGTGGSGGSVVSTGSNNGSDGGAGGVGGVGGAASAGAATATSDSRATINLTSSLTLNTVTNNGTVTSSSDAIGLQALSFGDGKALAIALANSDADNGSSGSAGTAGLTNPSITINTGGAGGAGGAGGVATTGAVRANADAQASVSTLASLTDNQVVNAGIMTSTGEAGINLVGDARSTATASSLAVTSLNTTNYANPGSYLTTAQNAAITHASASTNLSSNSGASAFNQLAGQAISSVLRNSVSNSGQVLAFTDGVAIVSNAQSILKTSNEVYALASTYSNATVPSGFDALTVSPSTGYQYSNGNSLASATNQSNSVTNSGSLIANSVGIKIWSDADSLVNQGNSGDYDFVRGSSQALSSTTSNQINSSGNVLVDIPFASTEGIGFSVKASSTNSTNIGGIEAAQKATALNQSNTIRNSGDLYVRSSVRSDGSSGASVTGSASSAATTLTGIDVSADATNTGRSKITGANSSAWGAAASDTLPNFDDLSTSARVNSNVITNTDLISVSPVARSTVTANGINLSSVATSNPNRFLESTFLTGTPAVYVEGVRATLDSNDVISSGTISVGGLNAYGIRMVSDATMNNPNSGGLTLSISSATANSNEVTLSGTVGVGSAASSLAAGTTINANSTTSITDAARSGNVGDLYVDSASSGNIYSNAGAISVVAGSGSGVAQGLGIAATSTLNFGEDQTTSDLLVRATSSSNQITQLSGGSLSISGLDSSFAYQIASNAVAQGSGAVTLNGTLADRVYATANSNTFSIAGQTSVVSNSPRGIELTSTATFNVDGSSTNNSADVQAKVNSNSVTQSGTMSLTAPTAAVGNFSYGVNLSALARDTSTNGASSLTTTLSEVNGSNINNTGTLSLLGGYDVSTDSTTRGNSSKSVGIRLSATSNLGNGNNSAAYVGTLGESLANTITNSGSINVASGSGIALLATATATSGDNTLNITNVGGTLSAFADVSNNTINNTGTIIVAGAGDADAINFEATATATTGNAGTRFLSNTVLSSGRIETPDDAINMDNVTFASANTITNTGTVIAGDDFVDLGGTTATLNTIRNSGSVTTGDDFVQIQGLTLTSNTVINSGSVVVADDFLQMDNSGGSGSPSDSITLSTIENSGRVIAGDFGVDMNATVSISNNTITNSGAMFTQDTLIRLDGDSSASVAGNTVTNSGSGFSFDHGIYIDSAATGGVVSGNSVTNSGRLVSRNEGIWLQGATLNTNTVSVSGVSIVDSRLTLEGSTLGRSDQQTWVAATHLGDAVKFEGPRSASNTNTLNISAPAYLAGDIKLANNAVVNVNLTSGLSHSTRWSIRSDSGTVVWNQNDQPATYVLGSDTAVDTKANLSGIVPWFISEGLTDARTSQRYDVYATIDPTAFTAAVNQVADLSGSVSTMMNQGMVANSAKTHSLWIGAIGHRLDYDGDRRAVNDYKTSLGSYALGYTYRYNPDWLLGAMIGSTDSTLRVASRYADLYGTSYDNKANGEFLSLNAGTKLYGFDVNLGISGGSQRHEDRRFVNDNLEWWGVSYAESKYTSNWLAPEITLAYPWTIETGLVLKPSVNVRYTNQKIGGYTETGSSSNATVQARTLGITDTTVGLDLTKTYGKSSLTGRVSYISRSSDEQDMVRVTMLGDTRNVSSFYRNFDAVRAGFIWKLNLASDLDLFVNANYLSGSDVKGADGNVALRLQF